MGKEEETAQFFIFDACDGLFQCFIIFHCGLTAFQVMSGQTAICNWFSFGTIPLYGPYTFAIISALSVFCKGVGGMLFLDKFQEAPLSAKLTGTLQWLTFLLM